MNLSSIPKHENERLASLRKTNLFNTPMERNFEDVTHYAQKVFNVPIAAISLVGSERLWYKSASGMDVCSIQREDSFCSHTILEDKALVVNDAQNDERFAKNPYVKGNPRVRFYAGFPIHASNQQCIGALCIIDTRPRSMSDQQLEKLKELAVWVDVQIKNHLYLRNPEIALNALDEAKRATLIDPYTRLWNKKGIRYILKEYLSNYQKKKTCFAVLHLSIDSLHGFAEEYGEELKEKLVKAVAANFLSGCRPEDSLAYLGDKEFMVVTQVVQENDALAVASQIKNNLIQEPIKLDELGKINVTVTIGIAHFDPTYHTSITRLLRDAAKALIYGKHQGGNCLMVATVHPTSGAPG